MSDSEFRSLMDAIVELTSKVEGYHLTSSTAIASIETRCKERHETQPQGNQREWAAAGIIFATFIGLSSLLVAIFKGK